jgi:hypothetical protein
MDWHDLVGLRLVDPAAARAREEELKVTRETPKKESAGAPPNPRAMRPRLESRPGTAALFGPCAWP